MKLYIETFFQAIFAQCIHPINSSWIKFLNWSLKAKYSRFYRHLGFSSVQDLDVNNVTSSLLCSLRTNYQRLTASSIPFTKETSGYSSGTTITKLTHLDIYEPLIHYYQFQTARADLLCMQSPSPIEFQRNVRFEDIIITIFRLVTLSDRRGLIENNIDILLGFYIDAYRIISRYIFQENLRQKCANNVISSLLQQLGLELVFIISAPLGLGKRSLLTNGNTTKDLWSSKGDHFWL